MRVIKKKRKNLLTGTPCTNPPNPDHIVLSRHRHCEGRVLDGPASGGKGSKGRNELDCIRGKGVRGP